MADRTALIARKQAVRGDLMHAQRELARLQALPDSWRTSRQIAKLQTKVERLMAEEYQLRLAIDRSG